MTGSLIKIPFKLERAPPPFEKNDIKYPEALVRHFLRQYTKTGDSVFDPFAGLGTTMFVAEEMRRKPFGIEADINRYEWVAGQMQNWMNLKCGDSAKAQKMGFPKMNFCMTSPPYMPQNDKWNPLFAGNPLHAGYDKYLKRMGYIFGQIAKLMKKNAMVIVQADNMAGKVFTPLPRDFSNVISKHLYLEDEIIVQWEGSRKDYTHTHCLVFKKK